MLDTVYSDFAYDDAFRTIESECDDLLLPFVNYYHNESYGSDARIIRGRNEHFIEHKDHSEDKKITDSSFAIEADGHRRMYHYECESGKYDDSLLVKMFEYDAQIALDLAEKESGRLNVVFPYSGILLLRGDGDFDNVKVHLTTPGGEVTYPIIIRRMSDLSIEYIMEKHLYMLLPFYIFNMERKLDEIESDEEKLERFADFYRDIIDILEKEVENGYLSLFSSSVIISLIHKVAYKMTMKRKKVQKKVGDVMGGRVLDLEVIRAHREGVAEGLSQGLNEGKAESINRLANYYLSQDSSLTKEEALEMSKKILDI